GAGAGRGRGRRQPTRRHGRGRRGLPARLIVMPGAGHFPWADDADRFVALVAGWLQSSGG
ncbi:MAG TPA: hypothetical protein DEQ43_24155, partial [Nocardioides bacterium]|nr:hypothetical protein [Nocardioides sp.]